MRRFIAVVVAVLAAGAANAAIIAGQERGVSAPGFSLAFGTQQILDVATDGTNFLVLWQNNAPGSAALDLSLVAPDGTPLIVPSRALQSGYSGGAAAVFVGDAYLVVWSDSGAHSMHIARINAKGETESESSLPNSLDVASIDAMAWNGLHALVAFRSFAGERLMLLDANGKILANNVAFLPTGPPLITLSASSGRFVAAWSETTRALAASISDTGVVGAAKPLTNDGAYVSSLNSASDGSRVAIAVVSQSLSMQRFFFDPATSSIESLPAFGVSSSHVRLMANGSDVLAYWPLLRGGELLLESVPFDGGALHETPIGSSATGDLRMITNGESLLAVWSDTRFSFAVPSPGAQLNGALLDTAAASVTRSDVPVAVSRLAQTVPAIAPAGDLSLVAWLDLKNTVVGDLVAVRVDASGVPIDAKPFVLDTNVPYWSHITAGFTGEVWIVAYSRADDQAQQNVVRRVRRDGTQVDAAPRFIPIAPWSFASNGTTSLIAGSTLQNVGVVRFSRAGELIDDVPIIVSTQFGYWPVVAASADEFLVAWTEGSNFWFTPTPNLRDVMGARLDANGALIDSTPVGIANGPSDENDAQVASDGRDFVVLYVDHRGELASGNLRARRVLHEGALAELSDVAQHVITSSIARVSGRYLAAYRVDQRVFAATLDDRGALTDTPPAVDDSVTFGGIVAASPSTVLFGYSRTTDVPRAFVRPITVASARGRGVRH